jgi:hypothetical protein
MKLRTKRVEKWVTIKEGKDKAEILIRPLNPKELSELMGTAQKVEWDQNQRFKEPDLYTYKIAKIHKVIVDWKGIEDEQGNPLECNEANRETVYLMNPQLIDKILTQADLISYDLKKEQEIEIKN